MPKWIPHNFQKKGVRFLIEHNAGVLVLDPGMGKTSIVLAAIKLLKQKDPSAKFLIIAPLRVCELVWPAEGRKWTDFNGLKMVFLHGPKKADLLNIEADIYLINPEGLDWLFDVTKVKMKNNKFKITTNLERLKKLKVNRLVIDELTAFKNHGSSRYKVMSTTHGLFKSRWGLTGSFASNGLMNLFGQVNTIDGGRTFGPYITHFRAEYFDPVPHSPYEFVLKKDGAERIYKKVKPISLRMAAEYYLEMPELIESVVKVKLPPAVRKIYDQLESDMFAALDNNEAMVARNAAAVSMMCRQLANGAIYDRSIVDMGTMKKGSSEEDFTVFHDEKLKALAEIYDELNGEQLLLTYEFHHDRARLLKHFGKDTPDLSKVKGKYLRNMEAAWNNNELPLMIAQAASIGHGLNLQTGGHLTNMSQLWDYEIYDQIIRRLLRQGSTHRRIFVYNIVAEDTIDEDIVGVRLKKMRTQNALYEAIKQRRLCKGR